MDDRREDDGRNWILGAALPLAAIALVVAIASALSGGDADDDAVRSPADEIAASAALKVEDPAAYTKQFVNDAVRLYEERGLDALLQHASDPGHMDGAWYIGVMDNEGTSIGHPNPAVRGQSLFGPAGIDVSGYRFGPSFVDATANGGWISYVYHNPETGECGQKHAWVVRRDDIFIGSGWYEPSHPLLPSKCAPADYAVATVDRAVAHYRAEGLDAAVARHSSAAATDGRFYVFILDANDGTVLAHPAATYIGENLTVGSEAYGDAGYFYARDLMQATPQGTFVPGVIGVPTVDERNPFHTIEEVKHYYAVRVDDLIFVSGWYTPAPTKADPGEYARLLVGRALTHLDDRGEASLLERYNDPESLDGPWYVFVLEDRWGDLYTVANSNLPDLVGTTRERIDANGYNYGEAFAAVTEQGGGEWVSYLITHPQTREDAPKHSWVVRRGDLLIGAGWYQGIE